MDFSEYQSLAMRTAKVTSVLDMMFHAQLGMSGETGEVSEAIKKAWFQRDEATPLDLEGLRTKVREEMGDILWYMALMCEALGLSFTDVARHNVKKLEKRYPNGWSRDGFLAREDTKEAS